MTSESEDTRTRVIIPKFLTFQVGTDGAGSIDLIQFDLTGLTLGDGSPAVVTGGDAGPGQVNVVVKSNGGQVTITESNDSGNLGLANVALDRIPYSQILTSSSSGALDAPTLSNSGGGLSTPTLTGGNVTNQAAVWTYTYANTIVPEPGTYGATGGGGGRVTYTATTAP